MKRFSDEWVWGWLRTQFPSVHGRPEPKPFAGKYPTRIAYLVTKMDDSGRFRRTVIRYVGKPSRGAALALMATMDELRRRNQTLPEFIAAEFDRANVISLTRSVFSHRPGYIYHPEVGILSVSKNEPLRGFYHPWEPVDYQIGGFATKLTPKKLTVGKKRWVVYSPFDKLKIETQIQPWRTAAKIAWPELGK